MVTIKIPKEEDLNGIIRLLDEHKINYMGIRDKLSNSMIVVYDNSIIGFSNYIVTDGIAILENVLVHKRYRNQNFGDGLVKAILNLVDKRGINRIYALSSKNYSEFLSKVGFEKEDNISEELIAKIGEIYDFTFDNIHIYFAKLPDFFNKGCKTR